MVISPRCSDNSCSDNYGVGMTKIEVPRGSRTIVVAEDEVLIRMDLVEMLAECGYEVVGQTGDGDSAVRIVREVRPDVVFMDVAMPGRDGLSAAGEIIAERLAPVVMVTAFSQAEIVQRAALMGALGYLVKPFNVSDLVPAIEMAVARWSQLHDLEAQISDLNERLAAREAIEKAKALIRQQSGLSEAEAYALIRGQAMDARITLLEAAVRILDNGSVTKSG